MHTLRIFGLSGSRDFAARIAEQIGPDVELSGHEEEFFDDDEAYLRSGVNVRGRDVFVIQSLFSCRRERVADKFMKLLIFIGSLRDASAERITVVAPYMAYARQDRKTRPREGIVTKYTAQWLESVGADRFLTIDIHNLSALQNGFRRCIPDNLEARNLLARYIADNTPRELHDKMTVMSPDIGGMVRTRLFRNALSKLLGVDLPMAILDKTHVGRVIQGHVVVGDVKDRKVVIVDDMIASGKTMSESKKAVEANGGEVWAACATHGLFVGRASDNLAAFDRIVVTDTVQPFRLEGKAKDNLTVISTTRLFAQAIRRIHDNDSVSDLFQ